MIVCNNKELLFIVYNHSPSHDMNEVCGKHTYTHRQCDLMRCQYKEKFVKETKKKNAFANVM